MSTLECRNIRKDFGSTQVLKDINLDVKSGEFIVLVGPSGCGKSTLLRIIAGLEQPSSGDILINGKSVRDVEPRKRDIAMVFQNYALYPHFTIRENLAFGLTLQNVPKKEIESRVQEVADVLKIGSFLNRRPKELSGGQRQRVALGRAMVRKTKLILFDEPLSNLDAGLRAQMRYEIKRLHALTGSTMVYVTHDQVEATTLGDRIAILNKGMIEQIAPARDIYEKPANHFVASFVGTPEMNFLPGELMSQPQTNIGVRPEDVLVGQGSHQAEFELQEYLGAQYLIHARLKDKSIRILSPKPRNEKRGEFFPIEIPLSKSHFFDKVSGQRIEV